MDLANIATNILNKNFNIPLNDICYSLELKDKFYTIAAKLFENVTEDLIQQHKITYFSKISFDEFISRFCNENECKDKKLGSLLKSFIKGLTILLVSYRLNKNIDDIQFNSSFIDDLGTDSLGVYDLILQFEEALEIDIPDNVVPIILSIENVFIYINIYTYILLEINTKLGILNTVTSDFDFKQIPTPILENILNFIRSEYKIDIQLNELNEDLNLNQFISIALMSKKIKDYLIMLNKSQEDSIIQYNEKIKNVSNSEFNDLIKNFANLLELRINNSQFSNQLTLKEIVDKFYNLLLNVE